VLAPLILLGQGKPQSLVTCSYTIRFNPLDARNGLFCLSEARIDPFIPVSLLTGKFNPSELSPSVFLPLESRKRAFNPTEAPRLAFRPTDARASSVC
jgi:hypothetical protein